MTTSCPKFLTEDIIVQQHHAEKVDKELSPPFLNLFKE